MWRNRLKNVESDNNKILYETLLDFFNSETVITFWISLVCMISGFRRYVNGNCALLGYHTANSGYSLPTFRDNLSVPFSRDKVTVLLKMVDRLSRNVCNSLPTFRDNPSVQFSYVKVTVVLKMVQIGCPETSVIPCWRFGINHRTHL